MGSAPWVAFMIEGAKEFRSAQEQVEKEFGGLEEGSRVGSWVRRWWGGSKVTGVVEKESEEWQVVMGRVEAHEKALGQILRRLVAWIGLKEEEGEWRGKETEIDSVEVLRAKVLSSADSVTFLCS